MMSKERKTAKTDDGDDRPSCLDGEIPQSPFGQHTEG